MVLTVRRLTRSASAPSHRTEGEVVAALAAHLSAQGFRTYVNPDGTDYFDLVARRGDEVGLVEAKVGDARTVLSQALRRRVWGDWSAIALAGDLAAQRVADRTRGTRAEPIGVWVARPGNVREVRSARRWVTPGVEDPYAELRARFRGILDALDRGELPTAVRWDGVPRAVRRASAGRGFAEWRFDEPECPKD